MLEDIKKNEKMGVWQVKAVLVWPGITHLLGTY